MPIRLPERCGPDCIAGFRSAAVQRHLDACRLADNERRTGAVYLWGYSIEMLLKAAFFRAFGYDSQRPITAADLRAAVQLAPSLGYAWPAGANLHHLPGWSQLLVRLRANLPNEAYPSLAFASRIQRRAVHVYQVWRETLRYHENRAYEFEVRAVRECAEWFLTHAAEL